MTVDLETVSQIILDQVRKERKSVLIPATVQSFDESAGHAQILVDGDDLALTAISLCGRLAANERVIVQFQPPQGVFIMGALGIGGLGEVGYVESRAAQAGVSSVTDINGPMSFDTFVFSTRKYEVKTCVPVLKDATQSLVAVYIRDGSNNVIMEGNQTVVSSGYDVINLFRRTTFSTQQITIKVSFAAAAGTVSRDIGAYAGYATLSLTDVGPA